MASIQARRTGQDGENDALESDVLNTFGDTLENETVAKTRGGWNDAAAVDDGAIPVAATTSTDKKRYARASGPHSAAPVAAFVKTAPVAPSVTATHSRYATNERRESAGERRRVAAGVGGPGERSDAPPPVAPRRTGARASAPRIDAAVARTCPPLLLVSVELGRAVGASSRASAQKAPPRPRSAPRSRSARVASGSSRSSSAACENRSPSDDSTSSTAGHACAAAASPIKKQNDTGRYRNKASKKRRRCTNEQS